MSPKNITKAIMKRHPEVKSLPSEQLRLVKVMLQEAVALSSQEVLSQEETESFFKKRVPDTGQPSAALRAYRLRQDMTQRQLSQKSGIPQPHIAAMESGKRPIGLIAAKKLALALGADYKKFV